MFVFYNDSMDITNSFLWIRRIHCIRIWLYSVYLTYCLGQIKQFKEYKSQSGASKKRRKSWVRFFSYIKQSIRSAVHNFFPNLFSIDFFLFNNHLKGLWITRGWVKKPFPYIARFEPMTSWYELRIMSTIAVILCLFPIVRQIPEKRSTVRA